MWMPAVASEGKLYERNALKFSALIFVVRFPRNSTSNRTDVRWVKLADTSGEGIFVESDRAFQFSIIPFSDVLLEKARHINELERDGLLTVHLDAEQAGVGTATCGPGVLPQYLVPLKKQSFEFTLYPVK